MYDVALLRALDAAGDPKARRILNMIPTGYAVSDGAWPDDPDWSAPAEPYGATSS